MTLGIIRPPMAGAKIIVQAREPGRISRNLPNFFSYLPKSNCFIGSFYNTDISYLKLTQFVGKEAC